MPVSTLQTRLEQIINDLSRLVQDISSITPENQRQLAIEIDTFLIRLSHLTSVNRRLFATRDAALRLTGSDDLAAMLYEEHWLGTVLKGAHAGIWVRNLMKDTVIWSPELRELLGVDPAEPCSTEAFFALVHPEDRQESIDNLQSFIQKGGSFKQEFRIIRPDGKVI